MGVGTIKLRYHGGDFLGSVEKATVLEGSLEEFSEGGRGEEKYLGG